MPVQHQRQLRLQATADGADDLPTLLETVVSPKAEDHDLAGAASDYETDDEEDEALVSPTFAPAAEGGDLSAKRDASPRHRKRRRCAAPGAAPASSLAVPAFDAAGVKPYSLRDSVAERLANARFRAPSARGTLHVGAEFEGFQQSNDCQYKVKVTVQNVDLHTSHMSGFLEIHGLTDAQPEITTYFDGELIGPRYSFLTRAWDADEATDRAHWDKFPEFAAFAERFNADGFALPNPGSSEARESGDVVFMRWKERFLVPDHRQTTVEGASFSGFYYVAMNVRTGTLTGYYFHVMSAWFQRLDLEYTGVLGFPSFEMR
ncbi:hypothetical protein H9P43_006491 [Blastocladiella emersonii ATCC 22665]|nr:hypothetical protein H9P43_006491 [Blastocladiella emersonii ATCC 22665]